MSRRRARAHIPEVILFSGTGHLPSHFHRDVQDASIHEDDESDREVSTEERLNIAYSNKERISRKRRRF